MSQAVRWTVSDLELFPEDGKLREIIDGEMFVSTQPDIYHQTTSGRLFAAFDAWDRGRGMGLASLSPGVIFSPEDAVAPDVIWISNERLRATLDPAGHLHVAPELVVEVLSPGAANERRDREAKLKLYSARGVREYWIVDWRLRLVEVYRRENLALHLAATLAEADILTTPLFEGFAYPLSRLFEGIPAV